MSQASQILRDLKRGRRISPLLALDRYGSMRLGARIWELKRKGHPIVKNMVRDRSTGKMWAVYSLPKDRAA